MNTLSNIFKFTLTMLALCVTSLLFGQGYFVPKLGIAIPMEAPMVDSFKVDSKAGFMLGLEFRSGTKKVYFNPALQLFYHKMKIEDHNNLDINENPILLKTTESVWLKAKIGATAELLNIGSSFSWQLRGGLSPGFLIVEPDIEEISPLFENYRPVFVEFHWGTGFDIKNVVIDFDYHISLVRRINTSDIVENTFVISIGLCLN